MGKVPPPLQMPGTRGEKEGDYLLLLPKCGEEGRKWKELLPFPPYTTPVVVGLLGFLGGLCHRGGGREGGKY